MKGKNRVDHDDIVYSGYEIEDVVQHKTTGETYTIMDTIDDVFYVIDESGNNFIFDKDELSITGKTVATANNEAFEIYRDIWEEQSNIPEEYKRYETIFDPHFLECRVIDPWNCLLIPHIVINYGDM